MHALSVKMVKSCGIAIGSGAQQTTLSAGAVGFKSRRDVVRCGCLMSPNSLFIRKSEHSDRR